MVCVAIFCPTMTITQRKPHRLGFDISGEMVVEHEPGKLTRDRSKVMDTIFGNVLEVARTSDFSVDSLYFRTDIKTPRAEDGALWIGIQYTEDDLINDGDKIFIESNDEIYWDSQIKMIEISDTFRFILSRKDESCNFALSLGGRADFVRSIIGSWSVDRYL